MKAPSIKLVHVLLGKSIVETAIVGILTIFAFLTVLPPYFHGWGEVTNTGIAGWAVNNAAPGERVQVQIFVDGRFQATLVANESRPDVVAAGWSADQWHGYSFPIAGLNAGLHEARVYAMHDSGGGLRKTLQLLGDPLKFSSDTNGKLMRLRASK